VKLKVDDTVTTGSRSTRSDSADPVPGSTDLVLTPDAAFLNDSSVQFPVTIDPVVTWKSGFDAFIQNTYSSDQSGGLELKLG
jgi:hypothetical protein